MVGLEISLSKCKFRPNKKYIWHLEDPCFLGLYVHKFQKVLLTSCIPNIYKICDRRKISQDKFEDKYLFIIEL